MSGETGGNSSRPGDQWEQRARSLSGEVQRWLIRSSARSLRDEVSDQVRRVFRGAEPDPREVWDQVTTEPSSSATEPPECAWCPICRAARMVADARRAAASPGPAAATAAGSAARTGATTRTDTDAWASAARGADPGAGAGSGRSSGPSSGQRPGAEPAPSAASAVADAAEAMIGAVREALSGLDSLLSYRPAAAGGAGEPGAAPGDGAASGGAAGDGGAGERLEGHERGPDDRG